MDSVAEDHRTRVVPQTWVKDYLNQIDVRAILRVTIILRQNFVEVN